MSVTSPSTEKSKSKVYRIISQTFQIYNFSKFDLILMLKRKINKKQKKTFKFLIVLCGALKFFYFYYKNIVTFCTKNYVQ